jgi:arylsulfatase A-like enzyme
MTPNILVVFVDNQPASMMGCSGNSEISTPNLDQLARRGVRFSNAFSPNAMCSPCRASFLTGMMPSQHGVHTWLDDYQMHLWPKGWNALDGIATLPDILSAKGYQTALIGKYHLGVSDAPQNGFRYWVTMDVGHVVSFYDSRIVDNGKHYVATEHSVDFFTRKAVEYIRQSRKGAPFFMALTYPAPYGHWPSIRGLPGNRFAESLRDLPMTSVPREGISKELLDWMLVRHDKMPTADANYYNSLARLPNDLTTLRNFYSQMSMVDDGVGQVVAALEEADLAENTIIIYTADHGMSLGTHGFWGPG